MADSSSTSSRVRAAVQVLQAYVPGEQQSEPDVLKLNTNENPYPPSPAVVDALAAIDPNELRLYPDPVCRSLRETLASYHACAPEQILVGNGSDEVLVLCLRAFVERGGTVGFFDPSYSLYPVLCAIEDVRTAPVQLNEDFTWAMPADYQADLFFLTNPNAPTGMLFPADLVEDFCRSFQGVVVIDEAYVDFAHADRLDLALDLENVLVTRSLSKSFSLAGLRLGYAVGHAALVEALLKIKDTYNIDCLTQRIAEAAIQNGAYMRDAVGRIQATRERTAKALRDLGCRVADSETNFLWVRPPEPGAAVLFEALRTRKILVRYFPGERTGDYLRITVGLDDEMDRLVQACEALLSRP